MENLVTNIRIDKEMFVYVQEDAIHSSALIVKNHKPFAMFYGSNEGITKFVKKLDKQEGGICLFVFHLN